MTKVSLAICVKNEERSIVRCFDSLVQSANQVQSSFEMYYYVCFNGTTDSSKKLFEAWMEKHKLPPHLKIIELQEGNLVEAQRAIHTQAENDGCKYFGYFDADIIINLHTVPELVEALEDDDSVVSAYAVSVPLKRSVQNSIIEKAMNLYDAGQSIYGERKHMHGRAFITKDWCIPKTDPPLLVDDVYLSFYYLTKYGPMSIKKCVRSVVMFHQIQSLRDYYRVYRRRNIEVMKCLTLFPEFKKLPGDQINRKFIWKEYFASKNIVLWTILLLVKKYSKIRLELERFWSPVIREQWETSITSKRSRTTPFLILIEGLDCSGKKTLARDLVRAYSSKGIASSINVGPLGPFWYQKASELVSLHRAPNFLRSFIYSLEIILGSREAKIKSGDIVFQVSSILRSSAYAKISNNTLRWLIFRLFAFRVPKYDYVIYLTSSYAERKRRHVYQLASGENSDTSKDVLRLKNFFRNLRPN